MIDHRLSAASLFTQFLLSVDDQCGVLGVRRVPSARRRGPISELERMRRRPDWTANDLFRFQHLNAVGDDQEEQRAVCMEWLNRLHAISKQFCYLTWSLSQYSFILLSYFRYASAVYTCYYRLAALITDLTEKRRLWQEVKKEYGEIFAMGRRIWRRPTHPSRLHIFYDMAMLCVRFKHLEACPDPRESEIVAGRRDDQVFRGATGRCEQL